jgi:YD repeat-containing protein
LSRFTKDEQYRTDTAAKQFAAEIEEDNAMAGTPPKDALETGDKGHTKGVKTNERVSAEADAGKGDLAKQSKAILDHLKAGGKSGITNEFGKPAFVDSARSVHTTDKHLDNTQPSHPSDKHLDETKSSHPTDKGTTTKTGEIRATYATLKADSSREQGVVAEVAQPELKAYEEWELNLKPNHATQSPDGGTVHADAKGRIDWIVDVKDQKTTIQYVGDSTQPVSIKIANGATLTWHGNGYGIPGQEGKVDAVLDQHTGIIRWSNRDGDETRHFPSGGTENEDRHGRVTSIINAYGQKTEFQYDDWHQYPVHITAGFDTGKPIRDFDLADGGKTPSYYYSGNADFGGGSRIAIVPDRHTGAIYTLSLPDNHDITNYQEMNTLKVNKVNGKTETLFDGDPNILPEPLRILMGAVKI